jgi:rod shape-determining protein MreC
VGTAVKGLDGAWRVQLDADDSSIDFVRILLFTDFSKLVDEKELSALPLPSGPAAPVRPQTDTMAAPAKPNFAAAPGPISTGSAATPAPTAAVVVRTHHPVRQSSAAPEAASNPVDQEPTP